MNNIVLIGMPSSGKSTVGVILAKTLGVGFVDTDLLIQQREGRLLQEIINSDGIEHFLDCERDAVLSLDCDNSLIATGGSVIFRDEAMQKLRKNGKIVYLDVSLQTVLERLNNIQTRGVAVKKGETIEDLYKERLPFYQHYADITIEADGLSTEETVSAILKAIK